MDRNDTITVIMDHIGNLEVLKCLNLNPFQSLLFKQHDGLHVLSELWIFLQSVSKLRLFKLLQWLFSIFEVSFCCMYIES